MKRKEKERPGGTPSKLQRVRIAMGGWKALAETMYKTRLTKEKRRQAGRRGGPEEAQTHQRGGDSRRSILSGVKKLGTLCPLGTKGGRGEKPSRKGKEK